MTRRIGRNRLLALLIALSCVLVSLVAATPANAVPPYTHNPTVSLSQTNPCADSTVTVKGQDFTPGSVVTIRIGSRVLGRVTVGDGSGSGFAAGAFTFSIKLPSGLTGNVTVIADGGSASNTATSEMTIDAACTAGASAGPGGSSAGPSGSADGANAGTGSNNSASGAGSNTTGLSSTGVAIFGMLVVALGLLGAGFVLVIGGRRRRATA